MLLDCIVDLLPSPWEKGARSLWMPRANRSRFHAPMKLLWQLMSLRPSQTHLSANFPMSKLSPVNWLLIPHRSTPGTGQPERLGKIIYIRGKKQEDTAYITAGDIGAVTKLAATETGDALCDPKKVLSFDPIHFPHPCLTMAIKAEAKGDEAKIASALQRLMEEDPTLAYENNAETHQQLISGLGEQHLDVLVSKLKNKFGVSFPWRFQGLLTAKPSARK